MTEPAICLVTYDRARKPDPDIAEVVRRLTAAGLRIGGLLQVTEEGSAEHCATLFLQDLGSDRWLKIFGCREEARGCRSAAYGLAKAVGWVGAAVDASPDILFVNRFGRQETEGRGLREKIAAAMNAGIPLVVPVNEALLPAWRAFASEASACMPADADRLEAWCRAQVPSPPHSGRQESQERVEGDALARCA